ncbi:hypothetical protein ACSSVY_004153 [Roseovarius sp. MBR-51]
MKAVPAEYVGLEVANGRRNHGWRECVMHALAIGAGVDPGADQDQELLDEYRLRSAPHMALAHAAPSHWVPFMSDGGPEHYAVTGIVVQLHAPMPVEANLRVQGRITEAAEGPSGEMSIEVEHEILSDAGDVLAMVRQQLRCGDDPALVHVQDDALDGAPSSRPADHTVEMPTHGQLALVHLGSGGGSPVNHDADVARLAGFERPILQDLAVIGIAGRALITACCDGLPEGFGEIAARLSGHVLPGEAVVTEIWNDGGTASFAASVEGRGVVCHGTFLVAPRAAWPGTEA